MTKKKPLTQQALATLGGQATLKKHGLEHYRKMVEKRWENQRAKAKKKVVKK